MKSSSEPLHPTQILAPAVMVHGLAHARAALALGSPVTLLSAKGAALAGGCGWWQALVRAARQTHPETPCQDILDCADAPGMAMAALRLKQGILLLDSACPAFPAVERAAIAQSALLLPSPPPSLDLASRGALRRLATYLGDAAQQMVTDADRDSAESLR